METLAVTLVPYNQTFILPKDWLRTTFPDSLFASTLELDPEATTLRIERSEVTPDVMQVLVDLSLGIEPEHHHPNLIAADRYLGIPSTLYYADPYYDQIPNRQDGNAEDNRAFITKLIREDRVWPFGYLILRGYLPRRLDLNIAASADAINILRKLLADPRIKPTAWLLLHHPIVGAGPKATAWLLANQQIDSADYNKAFTDAAAEGKSDIVALFLAEPKFDPTASSESAISWANSSGYFNIVEQLLDDPRIRQTLSPDELTRILLYEALYPSDDGRPYNNWAFRWAVKNKEFEQAHRLLEHPTVRANLTPEDTLLLGV